MSFGVLTDVTEDNAVVRVAENIIESAGKPFDVFGKQATLGARVGVALYPHHGDGPDILVKSADDAMYQAKASGKNRYRLAG